MYIILLFLLRLIFGFDVYLMVANFDAKRQQNKGDGIIWNI